MITEARVNELLRYEHQTGRLYWRYARGGEPAGKEAGTIAECGYRIIKIDHRRYMAHRLIWLIEYGYMPRRLHRRDGNKLNNHVLNLFDVDNGKLLMDDNTFYNALYRECASVLSIRAC